jgi:hypothetical protein
LVDNSKKDPWCESSVEVYGYNEKAVEVLMEKAATLNREEQ